jgi:hypothetical protein
MQKTSVVWLLESATYTYRLSAWVYSQLPSRGGKNNQKLVFVYNLGFQIFENLKKPHL